MKKLEKKYKIILIIITIFLCLTILTFTLKKRNLTNPEKIIKDMGMMVEKIFYEPIKFIEEKISLNSKEIEHLKNIEIEYNLEHDLVVEQKNTISELKQLLNLNYTLEDYTSISATVIKRNIDTFYQNLILDKGELDGIKEGMAVVSTGGIIGIIENTSYNTSTVKLLTSSFVLSVKIRAESEIYGLLNEYRDGLYKIEGISENTKIDEGMEVFTTGFGSEIPSGLKVGNVVKEEKDHFDLNRTIYVKPSIDINKINYVKILMRQI